MKTILRKTILTLGFFTTLLFFNHSFYAKDFSYSISQETFPNPDRGWYAFTLMLDDNDYNALAEEGFRLVYSAIVLRDFMSSDIDQSTLIKITNQFKKMRSAGIKAVLRVNYNEKDGGNNPDLLQIEQHMQQLAPIIEANKDAIAYIEGGYMGPWGEWHLYEVKNPPFSDTQPNWTRLINLLLANNPTEKFIMIRYPGKKQAIFKGQTITVENAFTSADIARIGHHNDCFVSSNNDVGTYEPSHSRYSSSIDDLKNYLKKDTRFSPMGGETCATHSRANCATTLAEMKDFRWTYMNRGYHPRVLTNWQNEGCFDEIDKRLGYRLELLNATLPSQIITGGKNSIILKIHNSGFSRPWYYRTPYIRLIQNNVVVAEIAVQDFDLRDIEANKTKTLLLEFETPSNLTGSVDIALWLPDAKPENHDNNRYSIRLANKNMWNLSFGHNVLARNITLITTTAKPKPQTLSPPWYSKTR